MISVRTPPRRHAAGLTLVELLVAMAVGLLVALAAVAVLLSARNGFTSVDAAAQLRDNARFAADQIQRLAVQAGYRDVAYAASSRRNLAGRADPEPFVFGFDSATLDRNDLSAAPRTSADGSDVLILRFQPAETVPGSGIADRSMLDCSGFAIDAPAAERDDTHLSVLTVAVSQGEPSLMCYRSASGQPPLAAQPLVRGVETFQVLYGVDGVTAGEPSAAAPSDSVPDRYLRANQLTVAGNAAATRANWRRVRSLRIGMVLRSDVIGAPAAEDGVLYPFGRARSGAAGAAQGSAFASASDVGTRLAAPADGRLRQAVSFTVHLRNDQGL